MRQFMLKLGSVLLLASLLFNTALATDAVVGKRLAAGTTQSFFIDPSGTLWAWGTTDSKRFKITTPARIMTGVQAVSASTRSIYSLVIKQDGSLWGWGRSDKGQLGVETKSFHDWIEEPIQILPAVRSVVAGEDTVFAIKPDGSLWAWGQARQSRGDKLKKNLTQPRKVVSRVKQVSTSATHTLALKEDGSLWSWGWNQCGGLGDGDTPDRHRPGKVNLKNLQGRKIVRIANNSGASYAVTEDGLAWRWGEGRSTAPGCADELTLIPTRMEEFDNVQDIAAGDLYQVRILTKEGVVWGAGGYVVEEGKTIPKGSWYKSLTSSNEFVRVTSNVQEISMGEDHALILKKDGTVWAWGNNKHGQLGDGTTTSRAELRQVIFPK